MPITVELICEYQRSGIPDLIQTFIYIIFAYK